MSGVPPEVVFFVQQIAVAFTDDLGNRRDIRGTGFWVRNNNVDYFVTNAHNIEPRIVLGSDTKFKLAGIKINLRLKAYDTWLPGNYDSEVIINDCVKIHISADVAVLKNPRFLHVPLGMTYQCFDVRDIADDKWINDHVNVMDTASFIGFPGAKGVPWYDELWNLGIARTVNIASHPEIGFSNSKIKTSDALLVSGLSFAGSSGSAVFSHEKAPRLTPVLGGGGYVSPKLIGIMSGHWGQQTTDADVFPHSGLSYFTRSGAILSLLV